MIPTNSQRLRQFVDEVTKYWYCEIGRRSQRGRDAWNWTRVRRIAHQYLPRPRILHPYQVNRFLARLEVRAE